MNNIKSINGMMNDDVLQAAIFSSYAAASDAVPTMVEYKW